LAQAKIQVLSGPQAGQEVVFRDSLILGRSQAAGLVLHHPTVSREHARIFFRNGTWNLVDLKSRNGTRLGARPVTKAELAEGDEITLGEVKIRFLVLEEEEGEGRSPVEEGRVPEGPGTGGEAGESPPSPGEGEISFGEEEIRLEGEGGRPGGPAGPGRDVSAGPPLSPPVRRISPRAAGRVSGPSLAGAGVKRLGEGMSGLSPTPAGRPKGGSILEEDLSQWSGFAKFLAWLLGLALAGALFYLAFVLVS